jgi:hypothetical protein
MNYINLYECPGCEAQNPMTEWHQTTADALSIEIAHIAPLDGEDVNDCFFHCPDCKEQFNGCGIELVFITPKSNAEALCLLHYEERMQ